VSKQLQSLRQAGFTIVELLVVIVVIGILAAITIVSYNGITTRANTVSAQSAAQNVIQKIEIYNAERGAYPYASTDLTTDPTTSYYVPATILFTLTTTQPATPSTLRFTKCGTTPNASQSDITSVNNNLTGIRIHYWTYSGTPNANNYYVAGNDSGAGVTCP
jgi:prepilin-type N-terminal cleavage/methylation domain-containing protein